MKKLFFVIALPLIFACENDKGSAINPKIELIKGEHSGDCLFVYAKGDTIPKFDSAKVLLGGK